MCVCVCIFVCAYIFTDSSIDQQVWLSNACRDCITSMMYYVGI